MILVTGATGTVGREVVRVLSESNASFRAMTRDPSKAKIQAELVKGDFDDPASLATAMKGVDKLFLLSVGPRLAELEGKAMVAAKAAGVRHVVKVSTNGVQNPAIALARWHLEAERHVQASGIPFTVLRPSGYMSNALSWAGSIKAQGQFYGAYGEMKVSPVHPVDIATCAVKALLDEVHEGQAYTLTGGELLTMNEQAQILSDAIGKPVRYVEVPEEKLAQNMLAAGRPQAMVDGVIELVRFIRDSGGGVISPDVEKVTGRKPLTWAQWCRENAAAFS